MKLDPMRSTKKYEILTFTKQVETGKLRETVDNLNIIPHK
jgi:hypothetical protein